MAFVAPHFVTVAGRPFALESVLFVPDGDALRLQRLELSTFDPVCVRALLNALNNGLGCSEPVIYRGRGTAGEPLEARMEVREYQASGPDRPGRFVLEPWR